MMRTIIKNIYSIVLQFVMAAMLFFGIGAKAQYPYNFSFSGFPVDSKTIVRSYDHERVVVYYEKEGKGHVALVNVVTNDAFTVQLDPTFLMNDMCIINDSVFLCGQEISYYGCIATMCLNNFYTSSVLVTYFEPSYWMNLNLKRIKVFKYSDALHDYTKFLLVGDIKYNCDNSPPAPFIYANHSYTDSNNHSTCTVNTVLEVSYPFTQSPSSIPFTQKVAKIINPQEHDEIIHDVVVTDNYAAFVGVAPGPSDSITLHICKRDDDVLKSVYPSYVSDFDTFFTYPIGSNRGSPFYHACALDGDKIAIVTQDEASTSSSDITVRTFDLTTHTMLNTQHLQCSSHPNLKDVTHIPELGRLVLLYNGYFRPTGNYCDIFSTVNPYNANPSYLLPGITENVFPYMKFSSLDALKSSYFITTGGLFGFVADAGNLVSDRICYDMDDYNIIDRGTVSANIVSFDYDILPLSSAFLYGVSQIKYVMLPVRCKEEN